MKPNEVGMWIHEDGGDKIAVRNMLDDPGTWRLRGFREDGREVELSMLPGNWRKLTPGESETCEEARAKLIKWLGEHIGTSGGEDTLIANKAAELFAGVQPPQPEVIEGRGQAWKPGRWLRETPNGDVDLVLYSDGFHPGFRYMRCPTFPPRPQFVAPPKPEQFLIHPRVNWKLGPMWAAKRGDDSYMMIGSTNEWHASEVDVIDPETGEPARRT